MASAYVSGRCRNDKQYNNIAHCVRTPEGIELWSLWCINIIYRSIFLVLPLLQRVIFSLKMALHHGSVVNSLILLLVYSKTPFTRMIWWCGVPSHTTLGHLYYWWTELWQLCGEFKPSLSGNRVSSKHARPHTVRASREFLRHITMLHWSARFLDLFPIPDHLGRLIGQPQIWPNLSWDYKICEMKWRKTP